ncbi:MAG: redoxin domain-containing protein [Flavobacterium sp.]|nr:MAG: redoxin domain-containing protein [Flavobacterium sp.]
MKTDANGDFEQYYQNLLSTSEKQFKLPEYSKMNVVAPKFVLTNLNGDEVSSENLKGKGVVLYFFSPNYSNLIANSRDSIFNSMAIKNSDNKDLVFLGIDKTYIFEQDEIKREHIRTYKLKEFIAIKDYSFNILLDRLNYNPKNTGLSYYSVADDYSSGEIGQFYIIDKAGMVKYKSYSGTNFQRELKAALALAQ